MSITTAATATNNGPKVEPLSCAIGAEVQNVNLCAAARDPGLMGEIRSLLLQYKVLFFRDQDITRAEHVAFARHFGELEDHPVAGSDPEHPGLVRIYKSPEAPNDRYENAWYTDATWREQPPFGCVLRCVECPPVGGDTMWANMALAYERLPEHIKRQIAGLRARHSIEATFGAAMPIEKRLALKAQFPDAEHPVVRTHPETGEKILFVMVGVIHPGVRATGASVLSLFQNLLGLAAGPFIAGALSDAVGLERALTLTPLGCVVAALSFPAARRAYAREYEAQAELPVVGATAPRPAE